MASVTLKNIKKVYPFNGDDAKKNKKKKENNMEKLSRQGFLKVAAARAVSGCRVRTSNRSAVRWARSLPSACR